MPGMKVTLDAAMRARDVSRPRAEHEDQAVASEPLSARARVKDTRVAQTAESVAADTPPGATAGGVPKGRSPRRRRRRR
jgi:hypothetical protein